MLTHIWNTTFLIKTVTKLNKEKALLMTSKAFFVP